MEVLIAAGSALWLGILTSISPCPMATNIAAVSFISKKIAHPAMVFMSGLAYTAGRMVAYSVLGWAIINSLLSVPEVAQFLQRYMLKALGPVLIVTGLFLLEIFTLRFSGLRLSHEYHNKLAESGVFGAFSLGLVFALAFCPVSAALFFGSLIPLSLNSTAGVSLPFVYGIGTGLPVFIFSLAIAVGVTSVSHWFHKVAKFELYTRKLTGVVFILVGFYYTGIYILRIF